MESNFSIGFFNFRRNKMKKNIREIILLFVAVLILASCATTKGAEGAKDSAKVEKTKNVLIAYNLKQISIFLFNRIIR